MRKPIKLILTRFVSVVLLLGLLFACTKDEEPRDPLIGNWDAISFTTSVPVDENGDGVKNTDLTKEIDCISMRCGFGENGSVSIESSHMTYEVDIVDGKVVMTPKGCEPSIQRGTWTVNEGYTQLDIEFVLEGSGERNLVTITIILSENQLVLKDMVYEEGEEPVLYTIEFVRA